MKNSRIILFLAVIALLISSCSDSSSPKIELNQPTELTISQIDIWQIVLTWEDNSKNEDGYKIERKFDDGDYELITTLNENIDTYLDNIALTREYRGIVYYKIYAYEDDDVSLSAEINAVIDFPAPSDLTGLYGNYVYLEWTDNSDGEEGFVIQRKKNAETYQEIDFISSEFTSYVDLDVEEENIYYYKVCAYVGDLYSESSNEVSVSTQSNPLSADFEADITSGFAPLTVIFDDLSTGSITSWEWNFGNGETSTLQNPTVTYSVAGSYTISLTVSDGTYQITETKEDYVEVYSSIFNDGFEDYDDFSINFSPWTNIDVDGSSTYGISGYSWQNANDSQAFIIFNPASTSPVLTDADAHSGSKYAACFSSADPTYLNNDWLITPQISLNDSYVLSFWAKSYTDQYGLERFNVGISTTGTNTSDFTIISTSPYEQAPTTWTEYSFDLSSYLGQDVYIAIQCVSADAFFLMIDDFVIGDSFNRSISNPVASQVNGKNKKEIK